VKASLRVDRAGYNPGDTIYVDVQICNGSVNDVYMSYIQLVKVRAYTNINHNLNNYKINCLVIVTLF